MSKNIDVKLTQYAKTSGWAAKFGPDVLAQVLRKLPKEDIRDENLLVGIETSDDAAVYKINDDVALIQTLDFFTPIVDDPYNYGRIAAANSLSDVYAMGGDPLIALNIVCFPACLDPSILSEVLKGGAEKVSEANCLLVGGHTVQDDEPKFGLSVTGTVHPDKVWANSNCKEKDVLIITKPIGTGILNTAFKGGIIDDNLEKNIIKYMSLLNKYAKDIAVKYPINSCTDITGFGLAGHLLEMAEGSNKTIKLHFDEIPIIDGTIEMFNLGLIPEGAYQNKSFIGDKIRVLNDNKNADIIFDPQTSGGLLFSLPENFANELVTELNKNNIESAIIGEVEKFNDKSLILV